MLIGMVVSVHIHHTECFISGTTDWIQIEFGNGGSTLIMIGMTAT